MNAGREITTIAKGFFMAVADSLPGISGSTVALILGFYEKLITSINSLIGSDRNKRRDCLIFLIKVGAGWIVGLGCSAYLLSGLLKSNIYIMSSAFLGLTICAIPIIIYKERDTLRGNYSGLVYTIIGIIVVCLITVLNPISSTVTQGHSPLVYAYVALSGMIAISAMILPGISGSSMLLILGIYMPVIESIKELLNMQFQNILLLISFGAGVITGLICIIKGIHHFLTSRRSQMMYLALGLMIGSTFAIAKGPEKVAEFQQAMDLSNFSIPAFAAGILILAAIEIIRKRIKGHE